MNSITCTYNPTEQRTAEGSLAAALSLSPGLNVQAEIKQVMRGDFGLPLDMLFELTGRVVPDPMNLFGEFVQPEHLADGQVFVYGQKEYYAGREMPAVLQIVWQEGGDTFFAKATKEEALSFLLGGLDVSLLTTVERWKPLINRTYYDFVAYKLGGLISVSPRVVKFLADYQEPILAVANNLGGSDAFELLFDLQQRGEQEWLELVNSQHLGPFVKYGPRSLEESDLGRVRGALQESLYASAVKAGVRDKSYRSARQGLIKDFSGEATFTWKGVRMHAKGIGPRGDQYRVSHDGGILFTLVD